MDKYVYSTYGTGDGGIVIESVTSQSFLGAITKIANYYGVETVVDTFYELEEELSKMGYILSEVVLIDEL